METLLRSVRQSGWTAENRRGGRRQDRLLDRPIPLGAARGPPLWDRGVPGYAAPSESGRVMRPGTEQHPAIPGPDAATEAFSNWAGPARSASLILLRIPGALRGDRGRVSARRVRIPGGLPVESNRSHALAKSARRSWDVQRLGEHPEGPSAAVGALWLLYPATWMWARV